MACYPVKRTAARDELARDPVYARVAAPAHARRTGRTQWPSPPTLFFLRGLTGPGECEGSRGGFSYLALQGHTLADSPASERTGTDIRRPVSMAGPWALVLAVACVGIAALISVLALAAQTPHAAALASLHATGAWPHRVPSYEPHVGEVLKNVDVRAHHPRRPRGRERSQASSALVPSEPPLVTGLTEREARRRIKGTPIAEAQELSARLPGKTQQLRYTGSYADTSYVVNAPEGDPATVYAHNSIWPRKVDPKIPYVETVHGDGTPYMQPLTVYAPPGGTVVSSVMPGTAARPPIPTRFASLPEADEAPLDNTVYQCQPSGYMVGPVGYHCTPACTDSALWRSDFGDCSVYRATFTPGGFKDYCGTDKDIAGVPAAVACPVSCGTCGIGLCYENGKFKSCKLSTYSTDEVDEESR